MEPIGGNDRRRAIFAEKASVPLAASGGRRIAIPFPGRINDLLVRSFPRPAFTTTPLTDTPGKDTLKS
jgi:hypothetical protein